MQFNENSVLGLRARGCCFKITGGSRDGLSPSRKWVPFVQLRG